MTYAILLVSASCVYPLAFTDGMAEAMSIAIEEKARCEGPNVDDGDNRIIIKRKLY